jgi:hypothetical protein
VVAGSAATALAFLLGRIPSKDSGPPRAATHGRSDSPNRFTVVPHHLTTYGFVFTPAAPAPTNSPAFTNTG